MTIAMKREYSGESKLKLDLGSLPTNYLNDDKNKKMIRNFTDQTANTLELMNDLYGALQFNHPSFYPLAKEVITATKKSPGNLSLFGERLEQALTIAEQSDDNLTLNQFRKKLEQAYSKIVTKEERKLQGIAARMNNKYGPAMYEALSRANKSAKSDNITLDHWIKLYEIILDSVIDRKNLQHN